jgi:hypothetical protein
MIFETLKRQAQLSLLAVGLLLTSFTAGYAQDSVAEMVLDDCALEIHDYCEWITPGRGRTAACLYAHNNKLSRQCAISLRVGLVQFRMILAAIDHVKTQCQGDLDKFCDDVKVGGGRVYRCLSHNKDKLNKSCSAAFAEAKEDIK